MYRYRLTLLLLMAASHFCKADKIGFEKGIPESFQTIGGGKMGISTSRYKEGTQSLKWTFSPMSKLEMPLEQPIALTPKRKEQAGIALWIYNEKPAEDSLRIELLDAKGKTAYRFGFHLASAGWRACWIGFRHMQAVASTDEIGSWRITAPRRKGRIYLDRITLPVEKANDRTTPDWQMPYNNSLAYRDLWHWCRVWQWEQYGYDIPLPEPLSQKERRELSVLEQRMDSMLYPAKVPARSVEAAYKLFEKAGIHRDKDIVGGAPLVAPDELQRQQRELTWSDLESMLAGFAYDALLNHSPQARENYFLTWAYAIDQGFAYGSGMGTNHHYGYQVRDIYTTAWLMRNEIGRAKQREDILKALSFWSALQETRRPCPSIRDELLDSWHTLLQAKTISALLIPDERERARAMYGLSRWISTSLHYTSGTIGGIKIDGTCFHHGGFYPAYTAGALGLLGEFVALTNGTCWLPTYPARTVLKKALLAMCTYSNRREWGIGISGRHPFGFGMKQADINALAHLACAGDLSGDVSVTGGIDKQLAEAYLRLCPNRTPLGDRLRQAGFSKGQSPNGFFVYNYGAAGIFRRDDWMVTLKGYTTDVWGSEIYVKDNRYGRYQSYGSVQIMAGSDRKGSGYQMEGWDWNRLPGTTTIHLPWELLDSPLPGTTMLHSKEDFAGCSSLQGENGMFAMKLMERNLKHFTPDFTARKSVFCFGNRMVCLGSNIHNSNQEYPTETTLYQCTLAGCSGKAGWLSSVPQCLTDGFGNRYYVRQGEVQTYAGMQESRHEKTRAVTHGSFASAWIAHGKAPQNGSYEYLVWIQPSENDVEQGLNPVETYQLLRQDSIAHIVHDRPTGITAYAVFEELQPDTDSIFYSLPREVMVMCRTTKASSQGNSLLMSVCFPGLDLEEKSYTTPCDSRTVSKELLLRGNWQLEEPNEKVLLQQVNDGLRKSCTRVIVQCQHGQPVILAMRHQGNEAVATR